MILEYLQPDPSLLDGLTVVLRAALLRRDDRQGGAGDVRHRRSGIACEQQEAARLRRVLLGGVVAGLLLSLLALGLRVLVLTRVRA